MGTKIKDLSPERARALGFRNVSDTASDVVNNGLNQTMSGMTVAAATPQGAEANTVPDATGIDADAPAAEPVAAEKDSLIADHYARLNAYLSAQPNINYEERYRSLLGDAEAQPAPRAPGQVQSFFSALGAPEDAPGLLAQERSRAHQAEQAKGAKILSLKEAILNASIQQEMQKGNNSKALKQAEELEKLHAKLGEIDRQNELDDWRSKQDTLQKNKKELAEAKEAAALERVNAAVAGRKELAGMSKDEQVKYVNAVMGLIRTLISQSDTDVTGASKARYSVDQAVEMAMNAITPAVGAAVPPLKAAAHGAAPAAEGAQLSPRARELQRLREERAKAAKPK